MTPIGSGFMIAAHRMNHTFLSQLQMQVAQTKSLRNRGKFDSLLPNQQSPRKRGKSLDRACTDHIL